MSEQQWWWSLTEGRAVTREERGRDDEVLGPYPSREAAEGWRDRVETRNEAWDEADREWEGDDRGETGDDLGAGAD
jgi:hypothetical protein